MESVASETGCEKSDNINTHKSMPKTAAQRNKEYRERLKLKKPEKPEKIAKTSAQRNKEYRERIKETKGPRQKEYKKCMKVKISKTSAQCSKEYRERQKAKFRFHHNRVQAKSTDKLLQEFKRLSLHSLKTKAQMLIDFISNKKGVSTFTFNIQSLRSHSLDLTDSVIQKSNVLLLSETNMNNDDKYDIPNFNCIVHSKRTNVRSGGVAIYQKTDDKANIDTPNMEVILRNTNNFRFEYSHVGDICSAVCQMENGVEVVIVVVYISINQKMLDIKEFILRALLEYSKDGAQIFKEFGRNYDKMPMILAGDFNTDFQKEESANFKQFLFDRFDLLMNNDPKKCTTQSHTTIDAVFSRYLENLESQTYISYFSYHRPIVLMLEIDENNEN